MTDRCVVKIDMVMKQMVHAHICAGGRAGEEGM